MRTREPLRALLGTALVLGCLLPVSAEEPPIPTAPEPPQVLTRAWIGVFLGEAVDGGVQLVAVVPGGPADQAGLSVGDVVLRAGEVHVESVRDLSRRLEITVPGQPIELELVRRGATLRRVVEPVGRPSGPDIVSRIVVQPPRPAAPVVAPAPRPAPRPATRRCCGDYGVRLADVTPDLRRHFGAPAEAGVLVTGVESGRDAARERGWQRVMLVGDAPYYGRFGFWKLDGVEMPPPTNPDRVLGHALAPDAWRGIYGTVTRWDQPAEA